MQLFFLIVILFLQSCINGALESYFPFDIFSFNISSVSPTGGTPAGGTLLTINATGVQSGATILVGTSPCVSVVILSKEVTCNTTAHAVGLVPIVITNPDGSSDILPNAYTYRDPPAVTAISPNIGFTIGGTSVSVTGTGFIPSATVTLGGVACSGTTVVSATSITCTTVASAAGVVDLVVTNPDGQISTLTGGFTYQPPPPPSVTTVASNVGFTLGGTNITITGTDFLNGVTVTLGGVACSGTTVVNATSITCTTGARAAGVVDLVVTNPDGQISTLTGGFTYQPPPPPSVTTVASNVGFTLGGTNITITGTDFLNGATVTLGGVACSGTTVVSATSITCTTGARAAGVVDLVVTNPDGQISTLTGGFTYQPPPPPSVTTVASNVGFTLGGTNITITGTDFLNGATVTLGGVACSGTTVVNATSITCTTGARAAGVVDLVVTNPDGQISTLTGGFTYQPPPPPSVTTVASNVGSTLGGTNITITGTDFLNGATVTLGGVACSGTTVVNATTITCTTGARAAGVVDLVVTNPDGQISTLTGGFTYQPPPPPTATIVAPITGDIAGGTPITITGTDFLNGATVTLGGVACSGTTVVNATTITCTTGARATGVVDLVVTNPDGQISTLTGGFTYQVIPPPDITSVSPVNGPSSGGTNLTIIGTGFQAGATVDVGVNNCVTSSITSTQIVCTTGAGSVGSVPVMINNPDGRSDTLANGFEYQTPPPVITSISVTVGPSSGGGDMTITGTGFLAITAAMYPTLPLNFISDLGRNQFQIGGNQCTSLLITSTNLICRGIPARTAGTVAVSYRNPDRQIGSLQNAYTYLAPPTLVSVLPTSGSSSGGTRLTITGTDFLAGAGVSVGGSACTSLTVLNRTTLECTTSIRVAGLVDVIFTSVGGEVTTLPGSYTYLLPPPTLNIVSPTSGTELGGAPLTLSGADFQAGATVTVGSSSCTVTGTVTPIEITCITPAGTVGVEDVTITNPDMRSDTLTASYTYQYVPPPTVTIINPVSGPNTGGTSITVTGTDFQANATMELGGIACVVTNVTSTQIDCTSGARVAGVVDIVVTNPDNQAATLTNGYEYQTSPAPTIATVSPSSTLATGGRLLTITGTNFANGVTVDLGGSPCMVINVTATQIDCSTTFHATGMVDVTITNPDMQSGILTNGHSFVLVLAVPPPVISSITPNSGAATGGDAIVIAGSGLQIGVAVNMGTVACAVTTVTATQINCTTTFHVAGLLDVVVTNPDNQSTTEVNGFTYTAVTPILPAPVVSFVNTNTGGILIVWGTGFQMGLRANLGGNNCPVLPGVSATRFICTIPTASSAGTVDLTVINPDAQTTTLAGAYTYSISTPPPSITGINPSLGAGGASATISGTDFAAGATVTLGGISCTGVMVVNSSTIQCTTGLSSTAGAVDVVVTNIDGQSDTWGGGYTYLLATPPSIGALFPQSASASGGTVVTIVGSDFLTGLRVTMGGNNCMTSSVSVTQIICTTTAGTLGAADVTITNPDGQTTTLIGGYTYSALTPPAVISVSPLYGDPAGGTNIDIAGTGFIAGATVDLGGSSCSVIFESPTLITCTTSAHALGTVDVMVTNPAPGNLAGTLSNGYAYQTAPAPSIAWITPTSGAIAGGTVLTINGSDFVAGATVDLGGSNCLITSETGVRIICLTTTHLTAVVDVVVTNPDNQSATENNGFTYMLGPPPTVSSINPGAAPPIGGTQVSIIGTGFGPGATVTLGGVPCSVAGLTPQTIQCTTGFRIGTGAVDVVVTNPDNQMGALAGGFTYQAVPAPSISSITPSSAAATGGNSVVIAGNNFQTGVTVSLGTSACTVTSLTATQINCTTTFHAPATVDVVVTNPDNQSATDASGFTYNPVTPSGPAPVINSISPAFGFAGGGGTLAIIGTNFQTGPIVNIGGINCPVLPGGMATQITCTIPAGSPGLADVILTNPDTQSTTLTAGYTYQASFPPIVTSITPDRGIFSGGTSISISGSGFVLGAVVDMEGNACTVVALTSTDITCVSPANTIGAVVDVTVTNPNNQSGILRNAFTYMNSPPVVLSPPYGVVISGASSASGPTSGGTPLLLWGSNFITPNVTVSVGGSNCIIEAYPPLAPASYFGCTTTARASGGFVDVVVTNPDGQSVTELGVFEYIAPPSPVLSFPLTGTTGGGTPMTITGTDFRTGARVSLGGVNCPTTSVDPTTIRCTTGSLMVPATVDVDVINPDNQVSTLAGGYTYRQFTPVINLVQPMSSPATGGTLLILSGSDFTAGATVNMGTSLCTVVTESPTTITCNAGFHAPGMVDVTVTNPDGRSGILTNGHSYTSVTPTLPAPIISSISPTSGSPLGGDILTINGNNFQTGATVTADGIACPVSAGGSPTRITCTTPSRTPGVTAIVVLTNPDSQSVTAATSFTYQSYLSPTASSIAPASGTALGGVSVVITGSDFRGATVTVGGGNCPSTNQTGTRITCTTPVHMPGAVDVVVTNSDGQISTLSSGFTYTPAPSPTIASFNTRIGSIAGGTTLVIRGSNFRNATVTLGTGNCPIRSQTNNRIVCTTAAHAPGVVDVVVTNPATVAYTPQTATSRNIYNYSDVRVRSVDPIAGIESGGTNITITGEGFQAGANVMIALLNCNNTVVVNATTITCTTPDSGLGVNSDANITVTNTNMHFDRLPNAFIYSTGFILNLIDPSIFSTAGGQNYRIRGQDLNQVVSVTIAGIPCVITRGTYYFVECRTQPTTPRTGLLIVTGVFSQTATMRDPTAAFGFVLISTQMTYANPPVITRISPSVGNIAGGDNVTITGTDFDSAVTVEIGGNPCNIMGTVSATQIICTTFASSTGTFDLTVTNPGNLMDTLPNGFIYNTSIYIDSVSPAGGVAAGGDTITITGGGFLNTTTILLGTSPCSSVTFVNSGQMTCVSPAGISGSSLDLQVINPNLNNFTVPDVFTYGVIPTIASISPNAGSTQGGDMVTITGIGFLAGTTVTLDGDACTGPTITSTQITCTTPAHSSGVVDLTVTLPSSLLATSTGAYTFDSIPVINTVTPDEGVFSGGTLITIDGVDFINGITATLGGSACTTVNFVNSGQVTCVTPANTVGTVADLELTNPGVTQAGTLASAFTYLPLPAINNISPNTGTLAGGDSVVITGADFLSGATVVIDGNSCAILRTISTEILCTSPSGMAGAVDVTVTNPNNLSSTSTNAYTYVARPLISTIAPDTGLLAGGDTITISGSGFDSGTTVTLGGNSCTSPNFVSASEITCVTPANTAGAVDVIVTDFASQTGTLTGGFTYTASTIFIGQVTPNMDIPAGGRAITIIGGGFDSGTTVTLGGNSCTSPNFVSASEITCVTPANTAGVVDVTVTDSISNSTTLASGFSYQDVAVLSWNPATDISMGYIGFTQSRTITLENTGTLSTSVISISFEGPDAAAYAIGNDNCSGPGNELTPSDTCDVQVIFLAGSLMQQLVDRVAVIRAEAVLGESSERSLTYNR